MGDVKRCPRGALPALLVALLNIGCHAGNDLSSGVERFLDAGAEVVLSHGPASPAGSWRVEDVPRLEIGQVEGEEPYVFHRIAHAHTLSDGRVVVVDAGSSSIRVFSREGLHLQSSGRAGEGPGEFHWPVVVHRLPGDTVAILQTLGRRVSFFDGEGSFIGLTTGQPGQPLPAHFVSTDRWVRIRTAPAPIELGYREPQRYVVPGTPEGDGSDTVAILRDARSLVAPRASGLFSVVALPFSDGDLSTVDRAGRLIYTGEGFEIVIKSLDSTEEIRGRVARTPLPVTDDGWNRAVDAELARHRQLAASLGAEGREVLETRQAALEGAERPTHMPAFDELVVDGRNHVWARGYLEPGQAAEHHEWIVFGPDGRWIATVEVPADLEILEIEAEHVLALWRDEFGVEKVRLHVLTRGG